MIKIVYLLYYSWKLLLGMKHQNHTNQTNINLKGKLIIRAHSFPRRKIPQPDSAVRTQIPRLVSKFHGPRKTAGPTNHACLCKPVECGWCINFDRFTASLLSISPQVTRIDSG